MVDEVDPPEVDPPEPDDDVPAWVTIIPRRYEPLRDEVHIVSFSRFHYRRDRDDRGPYRT